MMSGMTVGLLKEILIKHDLSDDDVIDFYFTDREIQLSREIEYFFSKFFCSLNKWIK